MPNKTYHILLFAILFLNVALLSPARAEFSIDCGLEYSWGSTTMESGNIPWGQGSVWYLDENDNPALVYPRTRIEFPLNVVMASFGASAKSGNWEIRATLKTNLDNPSTKGKEEEFALVYLADDDQDGEDEWWYQTVNGSVTPDLEGRLDMELDALDIDAKVRYKFYSSLSNPTKQTNWTDCFVGLGFKRQQLKYRCETTTITKADFVGEWSYAPEGQLWIHYDVVHTIPYFELAFSGKHDNFTTEVELGYSPLTIAHDRQNNHLGRIAGPYTADGDCEGSAILAEVQVGYEFEKNWLAKFGFDYLKIRTDGTQDVECSAGIMAEGTDSERSWEAGSWRNDEKIWSEQYALMVNLEYRF